jgi:hypothetical protein
MWRTAASEAQRRRVLNGPRSADCTPVMSTPHSGASRNLAVVPAESIQTESQQHDEAHCDASGHTRKQSSGNGGFHIGTAIVIFPLCGDHVTEFAPAFG